MEHKQCITDDLNNSPHSNQGFQADRFLKKTNQLNIPDTILENCSAELSGESLKMEVPKITVNCFNNDNKENIDGNDKVLYNDSLNDSMNFAIDNSYIKQCERKLLESSNSSSDDERNNEVNKSIVNNHLKVLRKFEETISTPPSMLRREISMLRAEMTETHKFHDIEIELLKNEKIMSEIDTENYGELLKKYSELLELYSTLKTEYDEYRRVQEQMGRELQSKTTDCLESLCSQIEASDNSLNFSTASFLSFNGGIRSSTMMEDMSEVEATVVHEATVLTNDPLSLSTNATFKTPMQTPLKNLKELFPQSLNSTLKKTVSEMKQTPKLDKTATLDQECQLQLLTLETALCDKEKEVKELEQRLFKVEDMSTTLQNEFERITLVYAKENNTLKENLAMTTEQLNELTDKLFTETISLNPSLRDSLIDVPGKKLLLVFIETIMESCKKIKGEDENLEDLRKTCESLEKKLANAEETILTRDEEIRLLHSHMSNVRETREALAAAKMKLSELEARLTLEEAEKKAGENRCLELRAAIDDLKRELDTNEKIRLELKAKLSTLEEEKSQIKKETVQIKELYDVALAQITEMEAIIKSNESEIIAIMEKIKLADGTIQQLQATLKIIENEKSDLETRCCELEETNKNLLRKIDSNEKEKVQAENDELKQKVLECEKTINELKENRDSKVEELLKEVEMLNNEKCGFSKTLDNLEERQKTLADALSDVGNDVDLPTERIAKAIANTQVQDSTETRETKIISVFVETITKTCKGVQNELIKQFDGKKAEWEAQRNVDLGLIENLQEQIKILMEKSNEHEVRITKMNVEKENLMALHESLKNQMAEAEKIISVCNEEIKELKQHESALKEANNELANVNEAMMQLKSQLSSAEAEKIGMERRCRELEEGKLDLESNNMKDLQSENEALKLRIAELNTNLELTEKKQQEKELRVTELHNEIEAANEIVELRDKLQDENEALKIRIAELEGTIEQLNKNLEQAEKELMEKESKITGLLNEVNKTKQFENLREALQNENEAHQLRISELVETIEALKTNLEQAEKELNEKESKITEFQNEICNNAKEIEELSQKLHNENETLKLQILDLEGAIVELNKSLEQAEKEKTEKDSKIIELQNEIGNNQKEIEELREKQQNEVFKLRITELEGTIEELKKNLEQAEKEQCERKLKITELQNEIGNSVNKIEELREHLQSENETLKLQIADLERTIAELKKSLQQAVEAQNEKESKIVELQNEIDSLKKEREELSVKVEYLEENNGKLTEVLSDVGSNLQVPEDVLLGVLSGNVESKTLNETINRLIKSQMEDLKQEKVAILETEQLDALRNMCNLLKTKFSEAEKTILEREEQIRGLQSELALIEQDFAASKAALTELETELTSSKTQKTNAETRCRSLEELIESLKLENEKTRRELQTQLSLTQEVKNESDRLRESCDDLKTRIIEVEGTVAERDQEILVLKSEQEKLQELKTTCENLESKLTEANSIISAREKDILNLQTDLEEAREEFVAADEALKWAETQKAEAENRFRELEKTIGELLNLRSELENQKSEIETENALLKQSLDDLKARITETENAVSTRNEEIVEVKENLACADKTILKLRSELKSAEVEKSEMENRYSELRERNQNLRVEIDNAMNLENNSAYRDIQMENGDLKGRILESEKMMAELKEDLELAKKDQRSNILKVEELIREIEELKKENTGFSCALTTIEETQKNLADALTEEGELPCERMTKLMEKTLQLPETRETKIVSDLVETIAKTCKGVQNELMKQFDNRKLEWESQKDVDMQNLEEKIKVLGEESDKKEVALEQAKMELKKADETIVKLKSQLSSTEVEKVEMEVRCRKLEEHTQTLQTEVDTKETIIKGLDELKIVRQKIETENGDLKRKVVESEELIIRLKKKLEVVTEEHTAKEAKIKESETELEFLKKENEGLLSLAEKLGKLEKNNKNLTDALSEVRSLLDMPEDSLKKILNGSTNSKIFGEKITNFVKDKTQGLTAENKHLKLGNDNLKEKVKQLTKLIGETNCGEDFANVTSSMILRNKPGRKSDLCVRRLDKLEEINHNLTELIGRILTITEFPDSEKLKLYSVRDFPNVMKKVAAHMEALNSRMRKMKEENAQLDEECEMYANIIKDLKKEAANVWKTNQEETEALEAEISRLKEQKDNLEKEKHELLEKVSKLDAECQKLKSSRNEGAPYCCTCTGNETKKINELKRTILVKEQKLLELQDLEAQTTSYKSQIEYLKTALEREKRKIGEEKDKNKKLQSELDEATKNQKNENKKGNENEVLEELRMRGSISGGIVQEFVDKEKMKKLAKDIAILKELCRARYAEIKRLEAVNAALRNNIPKNSNQMDSPIRSRGYNTRSKNPVRDLWKTESKGKENDAL